jgi:hypothetical protein
MASDQQTSEIRAGQAGPPPLRIHHLLVMTAIAAVLLSVNELLRRDDVMGTAQFITSGIGVVYTNATAIALTLVVFGVSWRFDGRAFFDLPGHWLLVKQSLSVGIFIAIVATGSLRALGLDDLENAPMYAYIVFANVGMIGVSIWVAWKVADSFAWRLWFILYGLEMPAIWLFASMGQLSETHIRLMPVILLIVLMLAGIGDKAASRVRDWPHWLAVGMQAVLLASAIVNWLWSA